MKTFLLASTALFFALTTQAGATAPIGNGVPQLESAKLVLMQTADSGSGHSGGSDDDGGNSGPGNSHDNDSDDDSDDDHSSSSSSDDNSNGSSNSNSKRKKKRVPGGSGCDSAGDIAEHAGCQG